MSLDEKPSKTKKDYPESVKLKSNYAFYDDDGKFFSWVENQEVVDSNEIKILVDKEAPLL